MKLTKNQIDSLKQLGIEVTANTTQDQAMAKMVEILSQHDVTGLDEEPFENLLMYCQAFVGDADSSQSEALASEVREQDKLSETSAEANDDEDDEEEELVVVRPKKASAPAPVAQKKTHAPPPPSQPKSKATPVKPTQTPKAPATPQKENKKPAAPLVATNGTKFDGRNNNSHVEYLNFLNEFFSPKETNYDLLKQGVTLRAQMQNTRPTVMNFDEVRINPDGTLIGNLYLNKFKSVEDLTEFLPEGFGEKYKIGMFRGETHPCIKQIGQAEIVDLFNNTQIVAETKRRAGVVDGKMSDNRKKMEDNLKSTTQKKK